MQRRTSFKAVAFVVSAFALNAEASDTSLTLSPEQPTNHEHVYISLTHELSRVCGEGDYDVAVSMVDQVIDVAFSQTRPAGSPPCPASGRRATAQIGPLPVGEYEVRAHFTDAGLPGIESASLTVAEQAREGCEASFDTTGFWWDTNDPGWSLSRIQTPSGDTATLWAAFDEDGNPAWFGLLPASQEDDCRAPVIRVEGGTWFGRDASESDPVTSVVGSAKFSPDLLPPDDDGQIRRIARFEYTLFGVDGARVVRPAEF